MKKFAKMSLVAAVAVAGFTSTASAVDLEQAIKGVDVSGQFRYRFNNITVENGATDTGSDVEIEVTAKVPVNDNVTAVFKIDNANDDADNSSTKDTVSVSKGSVDIEDYYFQYANGPLTVLVGQQNIPGQMTDGAQGDGIVALYNLGVATVGAAYFATNNVSDGSNVKVGTTTHTTLNIDDKDVASVIAMGSVGPVSFQAQYADVANVLDAYNLKADVKVDMFNGGLEYTTVDVDGSSKDYATFKAYAGASVGIVSAKLSYVQTDDNGSGSIDGFAGKTVTSGFSTETPSEFLLWNLGSAGQADLDLWALDVTAKVTDSISLRAAYAAGEAGNATTNDVNETLLQVSYKMSKNLNTYVRYSNFDNSGTSDLESDRGRIEIQYTF